MSSIVPFGKYKGQPIEALQADKPYLDWLMAQDWFRSRHEGLFTIIVNNFGEATSTPEHNALQALFLNQYYAAGLFDLVQPGDRLRRAASWNDYPIEKAREEIEWAQKRLGDHLESDHAWHREQRERAANELAILQPKLANLIKERDEKQPDPVQVQFEVKGADVVLNWLRVEVKPTVGDDYPAVMRQMMANRCGVLFLEHYTGVGARLDQFMGMFKASDIRVVFRAELERALIDVLI